MTVVTRRNFLKFTALGLLSAVSLSDHIGRVEASTPVILQVENISRPARLPSGQDGYMAAIRLTISHENFSPSHYVDLIEVDFQGKTLQFNLQPQTANPFTAEYDLDLIGLLERPNIKARAHCNKGDWSAWSQEVQVPEFSMAPLAVLVALGASLFAVRSAKKPRSLVEGD